MRKRTVKERKKAGENEKKNKKPRDGLLRLLWPSAFTFAFRHERPAQDYTSVLTLVPTLTQPALGLGPAFSSDTALHPLMARRIRLSANRERTRSPPPAFLAAETGS